MTVPALWKMNVIPSHTFVSGYNIEVCPIENSSHVELAGRIRGRRVDAEEGTFPVLPVKVVSTILFPFSLPFLLVLQNVWLFGQLLHDFQQRPNVILGYA
jgi:hypothetical protein